MFVLFVVALGVPWVSLNRFDRLNVIMHASSRGKGREGGHFRQHKHTWKQANAIRERGGTG